MAAGCWSTLRGVFGFEAAVKMCLSTLGRLIEVDTRAMVVIWSFRMVEICCWLVLVLLQAMFLIVLESKDPIGRRGSGCCSNGKNILCLGNDDIIQLHIGLRDGCPLPASYRRTLSGGYDSIRGSPCSINVTMCQIQVYQIDIIKSFYEKVVITFNE